MVFDGLSEVWQGIGEACDSGVVFWVDLDECWQTEDSWGILITGSFNGGGTGNTGDDNLFIFEWLPVKLKYRLSQGLLCEDLDDCWQTEDRRGRLITESFNGGGTGITGDEKQFLFEWLSLRLKHRLSRGVVRFLPWFFPVPLLWRWTIPFGRGMMNEIWVCGGIVCLLFFLFMANKRWETTFWRDNCSNVWVSLPGIKLSMSFLSQYNPN